MGRRRQYLKKASQPAIAVQLTLDTDGFSYRKWGAIQRCKAGDWIVNSGGDVYTVDAESFARTYRKSGDGAYLKIAPVWAEVAGQAGSLPTKEGLTHYRAGDYLVSNEPDGGDAYATPASRFAEMYELADESY